MERGIRRLVFLFTVFTLSSFISISASAEDCTFGYSYYEPSDNKVILPCIDVDSHCYYAEIRITPDNELVLEELTDTQLEVPLTNESNIVATYVQELNTLEIPELRIGGPSGALAGPFKVSLIPYLEDHTVKFKVEEISPTPMSNICDINNTKQMKAVMEIFTPPGEMERVIGCVEFTGPKEFVDGWINIFKASEANTGGYVAFQYLNSCPKAVAGCLAHEEENDPEKGQVYIYHYEASTVDQFNQFCNGLAKSEFGWGSLFFGTYGLDVVYGTTN